MKRIDETTVQLSNDEQIVGDIYLYLRTERGLTDEQAMRYLRRMDMTASRVLTGDFLAYLTDNEPLAAHRLLGPRCGQTIWPYTENNICVLRPEGHEGDHEDARGRKFTVPDGYRKTEACETAPESPGLNIEPHPAGTRFCHDKACECDLPYREAVEWRAPGLKGSPVFRLIAGQEYEITTMVRGVERRPRYSRLGFMGPVSGSRGRELEFSGRGPDRTHSGRYCGTTRVSIDSILEVKEVENNHAARYAFQRNPLPAPGTARTARRNRRI